MLDDWMTDEHRNGHARAKIIADIAHCKGCQRFWAGSRQTGSNPKLKATPSLPSPANHVRETLVYNCGLPAKFSMAELARSAMRPLFLIASLLVAAITVAQMQKAD